MNESLQRVNIAEYLSFLMATDRGKGDRVTEVVNRANEILGFLRRNLGQCPQKHESRRLNFPSETSIRIWTISMAAGAKKVDTRCRGCAEEGNKNDRKT